MALKLVKKIKVLPIFLLLAMFIASCSPKQPISETSSTFIPKLLDRHPSLQNGKEWDDVSNQYQNLKIEIAHKADNHESMIRLAQLFIREARITGEHGHYYNAALTMTNYVLESKDKTSNMEFLALTTKAGVQLSHHDFKDALETGKKAILLNPNNPQIYGVLVDAHVELGEYDKALKLADQMISLKPDLRSYARISYLREIHGQVDGAMEAMRMAIKAGIPGYEDTAWAMLTYAELNQLYGKDIEAEKLFQEILAQRPDYPFAIAGLGAIAKKKGDLAQAMVHTDKAIQIIPEVGFYIQKAEILKAQGKTESFDKTIKEIFAMLADDEKSGHNMTLEYAGLYLDVLDDAEKALDYAQREYTLRPQNIDVNRMMARIYNQLNKTTEMQKYLAVAKSTKSVHPELTM